MENKDMNGFSESDIEYDFKNDPNGREPRNLYLIPNLDRILAKAGWIRPNEAVVYYRKNNDDKYTYKVTFASDSFYLQEKWFTDHPDKINEEQILHGFESFYENVFTTDELLQAVILACTADFYFWEGNIELKEKYERQFEELTGTKF